MLLNRLRRVLLRSYRRRVSACLFVEELVSRCAPVALASANQQFLEQAYQDILHRPIDDSGRAYWGQQLNEGASRLQVVQGLLSSPEYQTNKIHEAYERLLDRVPEAEGLAGWQSVLAAGGNVDQLKAGVLGSAEFFANHGGTNDGYLAALYQAELGRTIDPTGQAFFGQQLAGKLPRSLVATEVLFSEEAGSALVSSLYQQYLQRPADQAGLQSWLDARLHGASLETLTAGFVASPEYFAKFAGVDVTTPEVTSPGNQLSAEGAAISLAITASDNSTLTYSATNLPAGLGIESSTGLIAGTIGLQAVGSYNVTVSASDGTNTGSASFTWTVTDNTTPVVTNPGNQAHAERASVSLTIAASDGDSDPLTYGAVNLPPGLHIEGGTGQISGTVGNQAVGSYAVTVSASDGVNTGSTSFTWTISDDTTPEVVNPGNQASNEGATVSLLVSAADTDNDPLTYSATNLPSGLSINHDTGAITGTIGNQAAGTYQVSVSASDGTNLGSASFTWTVSDVTTPSVTSPGNQLRAEGAVVSLAISAADSGNDPLIYSATNLPPNLSINPSTGVITGTVGNQAVGSYNVTVSASDGTNTGNANFTWTITDTTSPSVTSPGNQNNPEGAVISLAISAADDDNDPLTYSATNLPPNLSINTNTGLITGTLGNQSAGTYSVTITARDGVNMGSTSFTWTVTDGTTPTVTNPGNQTRAEGNVVSLPISATDADNDTLTYSATNLPPGLTINANTGTISGTLTAQSAGSYSVTVSASDSRNTGSTMFTWTVTDPTTPVVTNPGNQTSARGAVIGGSTPTTVTVRLTAVNDYSPDPTIRVGDTIHWVWDTSIPHTVTSVTGSIEVFESGIKSSVNSTFDHTFTQVGDFVYYCRIHGFDGNNGTAGGMAGVIRVQAASTFKITATDADNDPLTFTAMNLPPGLSINSSTGIISGTIGNAPGNFTVTIFASDSANTGSTTFTWTVT